MILRQDRDDDDAALFFPPEPTKHTGTNTCARTNRHEHTHRHTASHGGLDTTNNASYLSRSSAFSSSSVPPPSLFPTPHWITHLPVPSVIRRMVRVALRPHGRAAGRHARTTAACENNTPLNEEEATGL